MTWWTSLGPELLKAALMFVFGGGLVTLYKVRVGDRERRRLAPYHEGGEIVKVTEALQRIAAQSVESMSHELTAARQDLQATRGEIRETRRDMETQDGRHHEEIRRLHEQMNARDDSHADEIHRLRDVIEKLIGILRANAIPVPAHIQMELDDKNG